MIKIDCPLCSGHSFQDRYHKDNMTVVECNNCGLIFTNPQPGQRELFKHYNKNYYFCPNKDPKDNSRYFDYNTRYLKGNERQRFTGIFEKLAKFKPQGGRLLDVGTASGFFIEEANKRGWQAEGVEVSKWAVEYGRKNLKVKIFQGELSQAKFKSNTFEVVTFLDVLEHFQNPLAELKEASRILKKNGLIYIETINFDNFITHYLIGKKYKYMVPKFHLFYFGRRQLRQLLDKADFKILNEQLTSSSVGDYEYEGLSMYWAYLKKIFTSFGQKETNFAFKDLIKIYGQKD
ncbi:MAG: class I SAM-dependent methyltransferase [Patescibacteria group bacterium]